MRWERYSFIKLEDPNELHVQSASSLLKLPSVYSLALLLFPAAHVLLYAGLPSRPSFGLEMQSPDEKHCIVPVPSIF